MISSSSYLDKCLKIDRNDLAISADQHSSIFKKMLFLSNTDTDTPESPARSHSQHDQRDEHPEEVACVMHTDAGVDPMTVMVTASYANIAHTCE